MRKLFPLLAGVALTACTPEPQATQIMRVIHPQGTPLYAPPPYASKPGLTPQENLARQVRMELGAGRAVSDDMLRQAADGGDGFAAYRLAQSLEERGRPAGDVAHYYALAAASGRSGATYGLIRQLRRPDAASTGGQRLGWIEETLRSAARNGDAQAANFLIEAYSSGQPFGRDVDKAIALQRSSARQGNPKAALDIVTTTLARPDRSADDLRLALEMADLAIAKGDLSTRITAENLRRTIVTALEETGET